MYASDVLTLKFLNLIINLPVYYYMNVDNYSPQPLLLEYNWLDQQTFTWTNVATVLGAN